MAVRLSPPPSMIASLNRRCHGAVSAGIRREFSTFSTATRISVVYGEFLSSGIPDFTSDASLQPRCLRLYRGDHGARRKSLRIQRDDAFN